MLYKKKASLRGSSTRPSTTKLDFTEKHCYLQGCESPSELALVAAWTLLQDVPEAGYVYSAGACRLVSAPGPAFLEYHAPVVASVVAVSYPPHADQDLLLHLAAAVDQGHPWEEFDGLPLHAAPDQLLALHRVGDGPAAVVARAASEDALAAFVVCRIGAVQPARDRKSHQLEKTKFESPSN